MGFARNNRKGVTNAKLMARPKVMDFAADFTAIDFETASRRGDSACQLAAVRVRGGKIVDHAMWLIRPDPFHFSRSNIQIHGITPQQVRDCPVFGDLWPEIADQIGDDCLVAHNAGFDIGVLLKCLERHRCDVPELQFTCTRAVARRCWPHLRRFGLKPLAEWLGIRFRHHDALQDSFACAKILLAAGIDQEATSLGDLESRLKLHRGTAGAWGYRGPAGRRRRAGSPKSGRPTDATARSTPPHESAPHHDLYGSGRPREPERPPQLVDWHRLMIRAEFVRPLDGMNVVFSGRLKSLSQDQAEKLATRLGGTCCSLIDESTDVIVLGAGRHDPVDTVSENVRVVSETEFFEFVVSTPR